MLIHTPAPSFVTDYFAELGVLEQCSYYFLKVSYKLSWIELCLPSLLPFSSASLLWINWILKSLQFLLVFEEKKMQHPHMGLNIMFCRVSFFRDVSDSFKVFLVGLLKFFPTFMRIFLFSCFWYGIFIFISIAWGKLNGAPGKVTFLIQIRWIWFLIKKKKKG